MPGETGRPTRSTTTVASPADAIVDENVTAGDIDPLLAAEPGAVAALEAVAPTAPARDAPKRRWWQRIIEWDEPAGNGQGGNGHPVDVGVEANVARWDAAPPAAPDDVGTVDPLADWADTATARPVGAAPTTPPQPAAAEPAPGPIAGAAPEATNAEVDADVVATDGAGASGPVPTTETPAPAEPEKRTKPRARSRRSKQRADERWQWTPVPAVDLVPADERAPAADEAAAGEAPAADDSPGRHELDDSADWAEVPGSDGTAGSPSAWAPVPVTDLPDGAEPDVLDVPDAPIVEPARTGEFPRVPMLAAERARLEPEPQPEPTWLARRRAHRPRVRRVTRVVRRIDAWTVFKLSLLFWAVAYLILLVAGVLLWSVAISTGTVDNVESFIKDLLALDSFTFDGQKIFRASWVLGLFMAVAGTGLTVTMAVLYNLFADLVGGVRVTVLEEEVVQRPPSRPRQ